MRRDAVSSNRPELPRKREVITLLLHRVNGVLDFVERAHQRQQHRLDIVQKALTDPTVVLTKREFALELAAASKRHFANGARSPSALFPYLDPKVMQSALRDFESARAALPRIDMRTLNHSSMAQWVERFAQFLKAQARIIEIYRFLERDLVSALERIPDKTDTGADNSEKKPVRLPGNTEILTLARLINSEIAKEGSQLSVAMQFTNGNKKKAESLLRQLRRYPSLLNIRKRPPS